MKAIWITEPGSVDVLQVRETPDPEPGPGEVRVRVKAAGLNFAEVKARQGLYPDAPKMPCVVGYECAGVIDKVGEGVNSLKVDDRVIALSRFGAHADTVVVKAIQAFPMPENMTFEEGAAIPVNYLTAYHMLFRVHVLRPGERVLIHMAAGGVGIAALQLCKTVENVTTYGTSSAGKHDVIREQGCTHPIDYRTKDYAQEIRQLTDGRGVDLILDPLGGADWMKNFNLLAPVGRQIYFGFANINEGDDVSKAKVLWQLRHVPVSGLMTHPVKLMNDNRSVSGVNMGHLWDEVELLKEEMEALIALYKDGKIKPHIDAVLPFEKAGEAHLRLQNRKNIGKVVLTPE